MFSGLLQSGHTCGDHCWHAKELVCRCSCGGVNHGILLTAGGQQPVRTRKIDGQFYELVSVIAYDPAVCTATSMRNASIELARVCDERFPNLKAWAYGQFCKEKTMPVVDRQISNTQAKWQEVTAIPHAARMIWARPHGTPYLVSGPNHTSVYATYPLAAA